MNNNSDGHQLSFVTEQSINLQKMGRTRARNATYRAEKRARQKLAAAAAAASDGPVPAVAVPSSGSSSSESSSAGPVPDTTTFSPATAKKPRRHRPPRTISTLKHIQHFHKLFRKATREIRDADGSIRLANRRDAAELREEIEALKAEVEALKKSQKALAEAAQREMVRESEELRGQLRELNGAVNYLLKVDPEELKGDGAWFDQMKGEWKAWERLE